LPVRFWKAHAGESFNDRQRKVINRLLDGFEGKLTSSKWAKLTKCSQDTALRDISDLLSCRILTKDEAGGAQHELWIEADRGLNTDINGDKCRLVAVLALAARQC
jgi:hypothetical protein